MRFFYHIVVLLGLAVILVSCSRRRMYWSKGDYPYAYSFSLQYEDDVTEYKIKAPKKDEKTRIRGIIVDEFDIPIPGVNISIQGRNREEVVATQCDFDGNFEIELQPGAYTMETSYIGYDTFSLDFQIQPNTLLEFYIEPGRGPSLTNCIVHSKVPLTKSQVTEIRKCIEATDKRKEFNPNKYCANKTHYISLVI